MYSIKKEDFVHKSIANNVINLRKTITHKLIANYLFKLDVSIHVIGPHSVSVSS